MTLDPGLTDRVNSGPNTAQRKGRSIYFWTLQSPSITLPPLVGEDIKLLGFVSSFLRETKSRLDPFFLCLCPIFLAVRHLSHENNGKDEVENT